MIEKQIAVRDLTINYKIFGSNGTPFLILHGWGSKSDRWEAVGELLSKQGLQVIVPDLPGFGKSEVLKEAWCVDNYVEWVKEFSESVAELNNEFYLLGHSFGGAVSAKFSIKYPQKVKKLFLFAAAFNRQKTAKRQVLGKASRLAKLFSFLPFYPLARKAFYKFVVGSSDYLRVDGVMKETFSKITSEDLSQHLAFIKVPTTIIWGDKDEDTLVEDAHFANRKIDGSTLAIVEGADHNFEHKLPDIFAEKVIENLHIQVISSSDISL